MTPRRYGPLAGRHHGNPGLDREETAPRHGRGGKHLDHHLCVTAGAGGGGGRISPRPVVRDAPRGGQGEERKVQAKGKRHPTRERNLLVTAGSDAPKPGPTGV